MSCYTTSKQKIRKKLRRYYAYIFLWLVYSMALLACGACQYVTAQASVSNHPPVPPVYHVQMYSNKTISFNPLEHVIDIDGDSLFIANISMPAYGFATIESNGQSVEYTPNWSFTYDDVFWIVVCDTGTPNLCVEVPLHLSMQNVSYFLLPLDYTIPSEFIVGPQAAGNSEITAIYDSMWLSGGIPILNEFNTLTHFTQITINAANGFINPTNFYDVSLNDMNMEDNAPIVGNSPTNDNCWNGCVWPGDVNNDGTVNHFDVLGIGIAYGATGPQRPACANASVIWEAQNVPNWSMYMPDGTNFKYADANGDGIVNDADLEIIYLHYGNTHDTNTEFPDVTTSMPEVVLDVSNTSLYEGELTSIPVMLGTAEHAIEQFYGVVFSVAYDEFLVDGNMNMEFQNSWIGSTDELITFSKQIPEEGRIEIAVTRKNDEVRDGFGSIGTLNFVMEEILAGGTKAGTYSNNMSFSINALRSLEKRTTDVSVSTVESSLIVMNRNGNPNEDDDDDTGTKDGDTFIGTMNEAPDEVISRADLPILLPNTTIKIAGISIQLSPNPAILDGPLKVAFSSLIEEDTANNEDKTYTLLIYDLTGKKIYQKLLTNPNQWLQIHLHEAQFSRGLYFISLVDNTTKQTTITEKFLIK